MTIAIGTATIGSRVGALTLGAPIFDRLVSSKLPFVIEGAVLPAPFAILTDTRFARLEPWSRALSPAANRARQPGSGAAPRGRITLIAMLWL
ncbi:MAG: hypothetical protein WA459_05310 [Stellaceae bacterium]